ncbi:MAG TPA: hypothetical protein PK829_02320 [Promineifilum sp.]|nr:hypothetical protein [Promineifilum sp.]
MTTDSGTGRRLPEPAVCPNGHVNRPGTRICAVCRALIPPAATTAAPVAPPPAGPAPAAPGPARVANRALGLMLLLLALAVAALAVYYPVRRPAGSLPTTSITPPAATPLSTIVGIVLTPTLDVATLALAPGAGVPGPNLIHNGDFNADWSDGWERTAEGVTGVQTVATLPSTTPTADGAPPTPRLAMSKSGAGRVQLSQTIPLAQSPVGLVFRGQLRLSGVADGTGEGRSALMLRYEDSNGRLLGASVWLDGSATTSALWGHALPPFGPGVAPRSQTAAWQTIEVALAQEFADRLPDLDPEAVRRVVVVLLLAGTDDCPPDACVAELSAAALSLVPGELPR